MSYAGNTYQIPCDRGGFNGSRNIDNIPPEAMVHPTRNLNLHRGGREPRGGTALVNDAAFSGTPRCVGLYDFTLLNGNQFVITATGDGKIYKDSTTTIKTGLSSNKITCLTTFNDELYITNASNTVQTWDGSAGSTSDITNPASDWALYGQPFQLIPHGFGNSERLWAITSQGVYASAEGDGKEFVTGVVNIPISTYDNTGLVGAVEFGDRLICFGKRRAYIIDDTDITTANWGYQAAIWEGGAAHWRLICKTPNDVVCMTEDGEIYSITTVQQYGDYKAASLTRPAFINEWIRDNINLSYIADFHAVYDPSIRAIKWFMVRNGQTTVDMALVYFVDRGPNEGWMPHGNDTYESGYSASCSALVRVGAGNYKVYTGDYSGKIWKLEEANKNDNDNPYYAGFKSPNLNFDNARMTKKYKRGWVVMQSQGNYSLLVNTWVDGIALTQQSVSMAGSGAVWGEGVWGAFNWGGNEIIDSPYDIGTTGKRIQVEFFNSSVDQRFFISQAQFDHKMTGARPS